MVQFSREVCKVVFPADGFIHIEGRAVEQVILYIGHVLHVDIIKGPVFLDRTSKPGAGLVSFKAILHEISREVPLQEFRSTIERGSRPVDEKSFAGKLV